MAKTRRAIRRELKKVFMPRLMEIFGVCEEQVDYSDKPRQITDLLEDVWEKGHFAPPQEDPNPD